MSIETAEKLDGLFELTTAAVAVRTNDVTRRERFITMRHFRQGARTGAYLRGFGCMILAMV